MSAIGVPLHSFNSLRFALPCPIRNRVRSIRVKNENIHLKMTRHGVRLLRITHSNGQQQQQQKKRIETKTNGKLNYFIAFVGVKRDGEKISHERTCFTPHTALDNDQRKSKLSLFCFNRKKKIFLLSHLPSVSICIGWGGCVFLGAFTLPTPDATIIPHTQFESLLFSFLPYSSSVFFFFCKFPLR